MSLTAQQENEIRKTMFRLRHVFEQQWRQLEREADAIARDYQIAVEAKKMQRLRSRISPV